MEKNVNDFFSQITPGVFWDCNMEEITLQGNKNFVIARVLMRGLDNDIKIIHNNFTLDEIIEAIKKCNECDAKCINFYSVIKEYIEK